MFNELKTKDDAWMQSIHERIDRLSAMIDGIFGDGAVPPKEDVYLCDSEVACMPPEFCRKKHSDGKKRDNFRSP